MTHSWNNTYASYSALDRSCRFVYPAQYKAPGQGENSTFQDWYESSDDDQEDREPIARLSVAQQDTQGSNLDDFAAWHFAHLGVETEQAGGQGPCHFTRTFLDSQEAIRADLVQTRQQRDGTENVWRTVVIVALRPEGGRACTIWFSALNSRSSELLPQFEHLLESFHMNGGPADAVTGNIVKKTFGKANVTVEYPDDWRTGFDGGMAGCSLTYRYVNGEYPASFWMRLEPNEGSRTLDDFAREEYAYPDLDTVVLHEERRIIMGEPAIVRLVYTTPGYGRHSWPVALQGLTGLDMGRKIGGLSKALHVHLLHEGDGYRFGAVATHKAYDQFAGQVEYMLDHMKFWHHLRHNALYAMGTGQSTTPQPLPAGKKYVPVTRLYSVFTAPDHSYQFQYSGDTGITPDWTSPVADKDGSVRIGHGYRGDAAVFIMHYSEVYAGIAQFWDQWFEEKIGLDPRTLTTARYELRHTMLGGYDALQELFVCHSPSRGSFWNDLITCVPPDDGTHVFVLWMMISTPEPTEAMIRDFNHLVSSFQILLPREETPATHFSRLDVEPTGLSLSFPGVWRQCDRAGWDVCLHIPGENAGNILIRYVPGPFGTIGRFAEIVTQYLRQAPGAVITSQSSTTVGCEPGTLHVLASTKDGTRYRTLEAVALHAGNGLVLRYEAPVSAFESHITDVMRVLSTLSFHR